MHKVPNHSSAVEGLTDTHATGIFSIALVAYVLFLLVFPNIGHWAPDPAPAVMALVAMP